MARSKGYDVKFCFNNAYGEIFPKRDIIKHTGGGLCKCIPRIEHPAKGSTLIIHQPQDGRHIVERAMEIIKNHRTLKSYKCVSNIEVRVPHWGEYFYPGQIYKESPQWAPFPSEDTLLLVDEDGASVYVDAEQFEELIN